MKKIFYLVIVILGLGVVRPVMAAGPLLKFSPSNGSYTNGSTFTVALGVNSGTEKTMAVDVWSTFDATKLEVVSIVKSPTLSDNYGLSAGEANIDNTNGKFSMSFYSSGGSAAFEAKTISGDLATITFKAKGTGTANVNFTCAAASATDSNIFNTSSDDVIDCGANVNGSYTITEGGSSSDSTVTATLTPGPTKVSTLPNTGSVETTIGLMLFAVVGILSSLALRFL